MDEDLEVVADIDPNSIDDIADDADDSELIKDDDDVGVPSDDVGVPSDDEEKRMPQLRIAPARNHKKYAISDFDSGNYVVYPAHGVGIVEGIEQVSIGGQDLSLIKISFSSERLSVLLPVQKISDMGLRPISTNAEMQTALDALSKKKRVGRKMWSRRAQEYEAKINSGDPTAVAEVVRDLFRHSSANEQSFSERQLYKMALERFSRELAAVKAINEEQAVREVEAILELAAA